MDNPQQTRQRIMTVLEEVLAEDGTQGVSVSVIAQKAQVSKGFIYNHYGGVPGLLAYYIQHSGLFPSFTLEPSALGQGGDELSWLARQLSQYVRQLRASKASRAVLKAGLVGDATLSELINQTQHQALGQFTQRLVLPEEAGRRASLALLLGGLYYLTLMADANQPMLGIDLRSEAGWQGVEASLQRLCQQLGKAPRGERRLADPSASVSPSR
ncbi:TetR/AcrR family transcriptional regulator [Spirosoma validum]|uniref:TetR/AcrR family transcriptional regulator n=1 Tax=Spirosoma validum TaxID=2771355 RepID=A0A927B862_9BACT|nr:TetR/AcrR family transcriptional regulator [Spirosoma validum]MBD2757504.1 TetR/AcrR family transcriptional regulator [Spirosoma validum]